MVDENLKTRKLESMMTYQLCSIFVDIEGDGFNKLRLGGIYREHRLLLDYENNTGDDAEQIKRRQKQCKIWNNSGNNYCITIRDFIINIIDKDNNNILPNRLSDVIVDKITTYS